MKSIAPFLRMFHLAPRPAATSATAARRPRAVKAALAALAAMAMLTATGGAGAQSAAATATPTPLSHLDVAELERMFWICDWSTTRTALSRDMFTVCSVAWDELKARKFDGDYDRMIAWWRENKAAAHASLQGRRRAAEPAR